MTKKKRSCIDCMNLRHKKGWVWCRIPCFGACGPYSLPIYDTTVYREWAKSCEAFDDADL